MKFEKFLKSVGTHGEVIERTESEKWLVCGGVGMVIPKGVDNLLGTACKSDYASIVDVIAKADYDEPLVLEDAILFDPAGKAADIVRVFKSDLDTSIGIYNADYGLLEKKDYLSYFEIDIDVDENGVKLSEDEVKTVKYMLVFNPAGEVVGYITGSQRV